MPWKLEDPELSEEWPKAMFNQTSLFISALCRALQLCKQKLNNEKSSYPVSFPRSMHTLSGGMCDGFKQLIRKTHLIHLRAAPCY